MMIQIDLWSAIGLVVSILAGVAVLGKIALVLVGRSADQRHAEIGAQIAKIESATREEAAHWARVERELLELKADLPTHYVMRDDFIRVQSIIESKLDGLALRIENALLRRRES